MAQKNNNGNKFNIILFKLEKHSTCINYLQFHMCLNKHDWSWYLMLMWFGRDCGLARLMCEFFRVRLFVRKRLLSFEADNRFVEAFFEDFQLLIPKVEVTKYLQVLNGYKNFFLHFKVLTWPWGSLLYRNKFL